MQYFTFVVVLLPMDLSHYWLFDSAFDLRLEPTDRYSPVSRNSHI